MMENLHSWLIFLSDNSRSLGVKLFEQLYLVSVAMAIAVLLGIPLGILILRTPRLRSFVLGFAGLLQTIPGLALLAFLLPCFGIGAKPAIIALAIYALLPVIRNTVVGLETVPTVNIEAARGLGFTRWQRLWMVELPLALPTIVAGIRIAATISVGIATLAAFVGAGGLGDFINRGIALNNTRLLLLGAVPAGLLALLLDFSIGQVEAALVKGKTVPKQKNYLAMGFVGMLLCLPIFASGMSLFSSAQPQNTVRVATKNFTEQFILGEILAQTIEAKTSLKVERNFNLGTTEIAHLALICGQIDIYPEYTGTAYLTVLNKPYSGVSAEEIYRQVKADYLERFKVVWLAPFGFSNSQALAVREDFAKSLKLKNVSDLAPFMKNLVVGAPPEFVLRPDALPGLERVYGLRFREVKQFEPNLMYLALHDRQIDVIMASETDSRIPKYKLALLQDDKRLFPPYDVAPLVRAETLQAHPELEPVLKILANILDYRIMQRLNYEVDIQKRSPAEVVRQFLREKAII